MIGYIIGYSILAVGSAVIVYVLTRRWEKRFQAAITASLRGLDDIPTELDVDPEDSTELNGPILVEGAELRMLIRDAVREALAINGNPLVATDTSLRAP